MISEKLQKIGLNEKEAKIYSALLELGETNVQRISKKANIKRTTIYNILDSLKEKGLVSTVVKKKRKNYVASDPKELELRLEQQKSALKSLMPTLLSMTHLIDKKPNIKYFEGVEGLKEIYLDTLNYPDKPLWAWVSDFIDVITETLDKEFVDYYISKRVENKIMAYVIAPDSPRVKIYKSTDNKSLRQTKLDAELNNIEVEIDLYGGNKIAIMSFGERFGIIIESRLIYNTLKNIFDVSWSNLN